MLTEASVQWAVHQQAEGRNWLAPSRSLVLMGQLPLVWDPFLNRCLVFSNSRKPRELAKLSWWVL